MCNSIIPSHSVQLTYSSDELLPPKNVVGRNCLVMCRDLVRAGAKCVILSYLHILSS